MTLEQFIDGKTWREVTRTERYFVWRLASLIMNDPQYFVDKVLIQHLNLNSHLSELKWDVSTDVHLFRDIRFYMQRKPCEGQEYEHLSDSMEFDLVLFSNELLVIFEAKAWCKYEPDQLVKFKNELKSFSELSELDLKTKMFGIHSSRYSPTETTLSGFHNKGYITWQQLHSVYSNLYPDVSQDFIRADRCYPNKTDDRINNLLNGFEN